MAQSKTWRDSLGSLIAFKINAWFAALCCYLCFWWGVVGHYEFTHYLQIEDCEVPRGYALEELEKHRAFKSPWIRWDDRKAYMVMKYDCVHALYGLWLEGGKSDHVLKERIKRMDNR